MNKDKDRLKFISYDGDFPNLCRGTLIMELDGKKITFSEFCLSSGGNVSFDAEWNEKVTQGNWKISKFPIGFPEELRDRAVELVNENIRLGCCGGCG